MRAPKGKGGYPAAVLVTTANLHIRGMNRNTVIVDGTKPGSAVCSARKSAQNFGPRSRSSSSGYAVTATSKDTGLKGLMVYKAPHVSIENVTACNLLGGTDGDGQTGNEVWCNGGTGSGYLQGKSKAGEVTGAEYGVFSSNWNGGTWNEIYASNFNDSGFSGYAGRARRADSTRRRDRHISRRGPISLSHRTAA